MGSEQIEHLLSLFRERKNTVFIFISIILAYALIVLITQTMYNPKNMRKYLLIISRNNSFISNIRKLFIDYTIIEVEYKLNHVCDITYILFNSCFNTNILIILDENGSLKGIIMGNPTEQFLLNIINNYLKSHSSIFAYYEHVFCPLCPEHSNDFRVELIKEISPEIRQKILEKIKNLLQN